MAIRSDTESIDCRCSVTTGSLLRSLKEGLVGPRVPPHWLADNTQHQQVDDALEVRPHGLVRAPTCASEGLCANLASHYLV